MPGVLTDERRALVAAGALTLVDNLSEHEDASGQDENPEFGRTSFAEDLLCLSGSSPASAGRIARCCAPADAGNLDDAVAAAILAQLPNGVVSARASNRSCHRNRNLCQPTWTVQVVRRLT